MSVRTKATRLVEVLREEGPSGVAGRVARKAAKRWGSSEEPLYLRPEEVVDASTMAVPPRGGTTPAGEPLDIGWILTAPGPASGGHTTIFRFVEALEEAGHRCVLYVYDGQGGAAEQYTELIRTWWPRVRAEVRDLRDGIGGMDAYVATAWPTAHVLAGYGTVPGRRFYLAQDFEPYFYPLGSAYELAEETYRFGFTPITVGHMVADELTSRFDVAPIVAPFGCDREAYSVERTTGRDGVVFYTKPGVARRGYEMGVLALRRFHELRPDATIHTFGIEARRLPFPAQVHAHMTPAKLNELYNQCAAGLALSFTNISLIAYELLAAGVVPVVNDGRRTRADLVNPHVSWGRPTPDALADAIVAAYDMHREIGATAIGASVDGMSWEPAKRVVVDAIEQECAV